MPIVCAVVSSYLNFYNKSERKFLNNGRIKVRILEPLETRDLDLDGINELSKQLRDTMQHELDLLNNEIKLDKKYYSKAVDTASVNSASLPPADGNNNSIHEEETKKLK